MKSNKKISLEHIVGTTTLRKQLKIDEVETLKKKVS